MILLPFSMVLLAKIWGSLINKGTDFHEDDEEKRRCRLLNGLILIAIFLLIPAGLITNLILSRYAVVLVALITFVVYVVGLLLNWRGYITTAAIVSITISIGLILTVVYISEVQTTAVFAMLNIAIGSLYLLKSKALKYASIILSLMLFFVLNWYQLSHLPFDFPEFIPLVPLLVLLYFMITFSDSEIQRHRRKIEKQNNELNAQNETIRKQALDLSEAERIKHDQELALKQKDLEMVLASSSARDQLAHNIRKRLKTVMVSDDVKSALSVLINELNLQKDLIDKQELISQNMDVINADFYDRLHSKFPNLTKLEREFCSYIKLSLSNKEIAAIKNCTTNTINVGKTRLRKKMGFESNKALFKYFRDF